MREVVLLLIVLSFLFLASIHLKAATQLDITGPAGSGQFGTRVVLLPNGNFLVTDPFYDEGPVADVGAVYLYDGATGQLISTLTGSTAGDKISAGIDGGQSVFADGITLLANGNFVVSSPDWDNGSIVDAGAATWINGKTGLSGVVSAENSLIGSTAGDQVGQGFSSLVRIQPLPNGNYIVGSNLWDNGSAANAGAVTWGSGNTGVAGIITSANSLVGSTANDSVGRVATVLTNGNYVIGSPFWDNGTLTNAGAATWGSGKTGVTGHVSPLNSLVGSTAGDQVAYATALTNGNYVVGSSSWDHEGTVDAGASTWCDGTTGRVGPVSSANSLVGASNFDRVGDAVALTNGNYVVRSVEWSNRRGAVTWGKGTGGTTGVVSGSNSLVGSTSLDYVGNEILTLNNGNYVVISLGWDNGQVSDAGAVTWGNGDGVTAGAVSASNSLVGTRTDDGNFMSVTRMTNGNYVVSWPWWNNGTGAVTWGSGTTGISGEISSSNSRRSVYRRRCRSGNSSCKWQLRREQLIVGSLGSRGCDLVRGHRGHHRRCRNG
ncbi:MAG: hypothetical protein IPO41_17565 [Acidobacteria bacterium]|nr:hypothetical protein [Acidobacteriota bacterium]